MNLPIPLLAAGALTLALTSTTPAFADDNMSNAQPMGADRRSTTVTGDRTVQDRQTMGEHQQELDEDITPEDFVERASELGFAEIETANIALENSESEDVRQFAKKMIEDHKTANKELSRLASQAGLETANEADLMNKAKGMVLKMRDGVSFDQAYANNQVMAHEMTIQLFKSAATYVDNRELQQFASKTLPKLKQHLEEAKKLQAKYGDQEDRAAATRDTDGLPRYE